MPAGIPGSTMTPMTPGPIPAMPTNTKNTNSMITTPTPIPVITAMNTAGPIRMAMYGTLTASKMSTSVPARIITLRTGSTMRTMTTDGPSNTSRNTTTMSRSTTTMTPIPMPAITAITRITEVMKITAIMATTAITETGKNICPCAAVLQAAKKRHPAHLGRMSFFDF